VQIPKTSIHNWTFLEGIKTALQLDPIVEQSKKNDVGPPIEGLKAFGTIYAGWAFSQDFYRENLFKEFGFNTVHDLVKTWQTRFNYIHHKDILSMINTWQSADLSDNLIYCGDLVKGLKGIKAQTLIMPTSTDLYFRWEDAKSDSSVIPNSEFVIIPTKFGHVGGGPNRVPKDTAFIEENLKRFLNK